MKKLLAKILIPVLDKLARGLVPIIVGLIEESLKELIDKALKNIAVKNQESLDEYKKQLLKEVQNGIQEKK